jgi:glycyl-tRNA synthetase beta chain
MADRLHVYCRDRGLRYDAVRAVMQPEQLSRFNVLAIVSRIKTLDQFLSHANGQTFMPAWRRVHSILESEKPKTGTTADTYGAIDASLFTDPAEAALYDAISAVKPDADDASLLTEMASLAPLINAFFEAVKVNEDDQNIRQNRLNLLGQINNRIRAFADLSEIEG